METTEAVKKVIELYPDKVKEYKAGKEGMVGLFCGGAMKLTRGLADPKELLILLKQELEK